MAVIKGNIFPASLKNRFLMKTAIFHALKKEYNQKLTLKCESDIISLERYAVILPRRKYYGKYSKKRKQLSH